VQGRAFGGQKLAGSTEIAVAAIAEYLRR
jgi:hypothetical protein